MSDASLIIGLWAESSVDPDADALMHRTSFVGCRHMKVLLSTEARRVFCRDCGHEIDAFGFLSRLCGEWELWVRARDDAEQGAKAAQERLSELLRLERNARGRLKRIDPAAAKDAPQRPWGG